MKKYNITFTVTVSEDVTQIAIEEEVLDLLSKGDKIIVISNIQTIEKDK